MPAREHLHRASTWVLRGLAAIVMLSIAWSSWHDVSQAWDSGYYHLPFAARLAGIVRSDAYVFDVENQARFQGFPLLGELLQGIFWRVTGRVQAANFVALLSIPLYAWALRKRFDVPLHVSLLSLLAIPLVMTHASSCYVDLPANLALSVVVLLAIEAWAAPRELDAKTILLAVSCAAIAANMKALLHVIVALALGAIFLRLWRRNERRKAFAVAACTPIVFFTPLKNLVLHKNPYYPLEWSLFGHAFAGTEAPYSSSPPWLEHAPEPVRFVCSLLEIGIRPMSDPRRWSVDQWMPQSSMGNRLGGFFGAYVIANVLCLAWLAWRDREGVTRRIAACFAIFTCVVSVMPQAHELRYYLSWMIVLVSVNAWIASRSISRSAWISGLSWMAAASMLTVIWVTRADYVVPSGSSLAEILQHKIDEKSVAQVRDGARVCVDRAPYSLYYAAPFHAPRRYVVQEAETSGECGREPQL